MRERENVKSEKTYKGGKNECECGWPELRNVIHAEARNPH